MSRLNVLSFHPTQTLTCALGERGPRPGEAWRPPQAGQRASGGRGHRGGAGLVGGAEALDGTLGSRRTGGAGGDVILGGI